MGQSYSHLESADETLTGENRSRQRQPQQQGSDATGSANTANGSIRVRSTALAGVAGNSHRRAQREVRRFSPYTVVPPSRDSLRSSVASASVVRVAVRRRNREIQVIDESDDAEMHSAESNDNDTDVDGEENYNENDESRSLPYQQQEQNNEEASSDQHHQTDDAEMSEAVSEQTSEEQDASPSGSHSRPQPRRVRHTGNELFSRIVSRSVISSIADELLRRRQMRRAIIDTLNSRRSTESQGSAERSEPSSEPIVNAHGGYIGEQTSSVIAARDNTHGGNDIASGQSAITSNRRSSNLRIPSGYALDLTGRIDLYYNVSLFILSILESRFGVTRIQQAQQQHNDREVQNEGTNEGTNEDSSENNDNADASAGGEDTTRETQVVAAESESQMHSRMFLLPGAIEQALDDYDNRNGNANENNDSNIQEQEASESDAEQSPTSAVNSGSGSGSGSSSTRQHNNDEQERLSRQRSREEKLRRLRNIAQAMHDDRRNIEVPIIFMAIKIGPSLQNINFPTERTEGGGTRVVRLGSSAASTSQASASSGSSNGDDRSGQQQNHQQGQSEDNTNDDNTVLTSQVSAGVATGVEGDEQNRGADEGGGVGIRATLAGIRNRVSSLMMGVLSRRHMQRHGVTSETTESPATAAEDETGREDGTGSRGRGEGIAPGLSVYVSINEIPLRSPMILPLVAYSLFPELQREDSEEGSRSDSSSSGGNYDLYMEIANIIGEATSTKVSQEAVDKTLAKYKVVKTVDSTGVVVAQQDTKDIQSQVRMISAERCPVCLENFEIENPVRVLNCHHGMHIECADTWFTQGSNKCPVCRSEAVPLDRNQRKRA